jgi:hypothetical protein
VLNAVLATAIEPGRVDVLARPLEALIPFRDLRVIDRAKLRCAYEDGIQPYAIHHYLPTKPWLQPTMPGVYTELLIRLLHWPDVAIRVPEDELPPHLRPGVLGAARRWYHGRVGVRIGAVRERLLGVAEPAPG